jgi:hypothetical protein
MGIVIAALMPVFLLIVLGAVLKRTLMRLETQWHGLERLTYYVLFPMLLIQTLVKADLTTVPVAGVGGALLLSALVVSLLCADFSQRLCTGATNGRRRAIAGADHHAANDPGGDHDADRDRAGGFELDWPGSAGSMTAPDTAIITSATIVLLNYSVITRKTC